MSPVAFGGLDGTQYAPLPLRSVCESKCAQLRESDGAQYHGHACHRCMGRSTHRYALSYLSVECGTYICPW